MMKRWPNSAAELEAEQVGLAALAPSRWIHSESGVAGGCFVCFERGVPGAGSAGDRGWAAAAVRALPSPPAVLLVDATGRDHPRRAGLALHLGYVLDMPTVGVTHRPLLAAGEWPGGERGCVNPLTLDSSVVGYWIRTVPGRRPLAVHAAWRTDAETAIDVVLRCSQRFRTPDPLRWARQAARHARSAR